MFLSSRQGLHTRARPSMHGHIESLSATQINSVMQDSAKCDSENNQTLSCLAAIKCLTGHMQPVNCVAWSPKDDHIASASDDKTVIIWNALTGRQIHKLQGHSKWVISVAWSPDGTQILGSNGYTLIVWDAVSGDTVSKHECSDETSMMEPPAMSVAWSPKGDQVVYGVGYRYSCRSGAIVIWDVRARNKADRLKVHSDAVMNVAWSPVGNKIASGSNRNVVSIWDLNTSDGVHLSLKLSGHTAAITSLAWSPKEEKVLSGSEDKTLIVWDTANGDRLLQFEGHSAVVKSVAWSPNGSQILSGGVGSDGVDSPGEIFVWDAVSGVQVFKLVQHSEAVYCVAWSPRGVQIASASRDKTVLVWKLEIGDEEQKASTQAVSYVDLSREQRLSGCKQIESSGNEGPNEKIFLQKLEGKEKVSVTMVVSNVIFKGKIKRMGNFTEDNKGRVWKDSKDCEIVGKYDGDCPVQCYRKERGFCCFALYDGREFAWEEPCPKKIQIMSHVLINESEQLRKFGPSGEIINSANPDIANRFCDQRLKVELQVAVSHNEELRRNLREVEERIHQLSEEWRLERDQIIGDYSRQIADMKAQERFCSVGKSATKRVYERIEQEQSRSLISMERSKDLQISSEEEAREFVYRLADNWDQVRFSRIIICNSLKNLGPSLYSSAAHFVSELIQNADDCRYSDTLSAPQLKIFLSKSHMIIVKNEDGFRPADVYSLCSLSESTKTGSEKNIGHKGIGFKAVFAISDNPTIFSPPWYFCFSKGWDEIESYITPRWLDEAKRQELDVFLKRIPQSEFNGKGSLLYLPYRTEMYSIVESELQSAKLVDEASLFFLRQLKKIEIVDCEHSSNSLSFKIEILRSIYCEHLLCKSKTWLDIPKFSEELLYRSSSVCRTFIARVVLKIPDYLAPAKDANTEITICFPLDWIDLCRESYSVYAFLPICRQGFPFKIHADWIISTNRESLNESSSFNMFLRDECAKLISTVIVSEGLIAQPIHYIPEISDRLSPWWCEFVHKIHCSVMNTAFGKEHNVLLGDEARTLLEIISEMDLKTYGGVSIWDSECNKSRFKEFLPKMSCRLETLSMRHILKCLPDDDENAFLSAIPSSSKQLRDGPIILSWTIFFERLLECEDKTVLELCRAKAIYLQMNSPKMIRKCVKSWSNTFIIPPKSSYLLKVSKRILQNEYIYLLDYESDFELQFLERIVPNKFLGIKAAVLQICKLHCYYHLLYKTIQQETPDFFISPILYEDLENLIEELVFLFENKSFAEEAIEDILGRSAKTCTDMLSPFWIPVENPKFPKDNTFLNPNSVRVCCASVSNTRIQSVLGIECPAWVASEKSAEAESQVRQDQLFAIKYPSHREWFYVSYSNVKYNAIYPIKDGLCFSAQDVVQRRLEVERLKWESLLAWLGAQSPESFPPSNSEIPKLDLRDYFDCICRFGLGSNFVLLMEFHCDAAFEWFRKQLKHKVYLNLTCENDPKLSYFSLLLPTIKLPDFLPAILARKLGIISSIVHDLDLVLRSALQILGCHDKPSDELKNQEKKEFVRAQIFEHLNLANDETRRLACSSHIFKILPSTVVKDNLQPEPLFSAIHSFKFVCVAENSKLQSDAMMRALSAARRMKYIEFVVVQSESELVFLRDNTNLIEQLNERTAVEIITRRHWDKHVNNDELEKLRMEGRHLPMEKEYFDEIQDELFFLFKHKDTTVSTLKQLSSDKSLKEIALTNYLWVPVQALRVAGYSTTDGIKTVFSGESQLFKIERDLEKHLVYIQSPAKCPIAICSILSMEYFSLDFDFIALAESFTLPKTARNIGRLLTWELLLSWIGCLSFCQPADQTRTYTGQDPSFSLGTFVKHVVTTGCESELAALISFHSENALSWFQSNLDGLCLSKKWLESPLFSYVKLDFLRVGEKCLQNDENFLHFQYNEYLLCFNEMFLDVPDSLDLVLGKISFVSHQSCLTREVTNEVLKFCLGCRGKHNRATFCALLSEFWSTEQSEAFFNHLKDAPTHILLLALESPIFRTPAEIHYSCCRCRLRSDPTNVYFLENQYKIECQISLACDDSAKNPYQVVCGDSPAEDAFLERCHREFNKPRKIDGPTLQKKIYTCMGNSGISFKLPNIQLQSQIQKSKSGGSNKINSELSPNTGAAKQEITGRNISNTITNKQSSFFMDLSSKSQALQQAKKKNEVDESLGHVQTWAEHLDELEEFGPKAGHFFCPDSDLQKQLIYIGKEAESIVFEKISEFSRLRKTAFPIENWVSSFSKDIRRLNQVSEDTVDDTCGFDFLVDSRMIFDNLTCRNKICRIEVKGSTKSDSFDFHITGNELKAMQDNEDEYVVVLVGGIQINSGTNRGKILGYIDKSMFTTTEGTYDFHLPRTTSGGLALQPQDFKVCWEKSHLSTCSFELFPQAVDTQS